MFLYDVVDAFDKAKLKYAVVGGYALALHGIVRATVDIDIVLRLTLADFEKAESVLEKINLKSRLPVRAQDIIKMRKEYIEKRNLLAWSFVDYQNPSRQLDILIVKDLKNIETVTRSVAGRKINVASLEELLAMKKEAGRPQDQIDVENIKGRLHEKK